MANLKIKSALISVFSKEGIEEIVNELIKNHVIIYSTGGTYDFIKNLGHKVIKVEDITTFPSIFGGRVKTLHPKIFGGILFRREYEKDKKEKEEFQIPQIDLVIVDLYPFEETVKSGASENDVIEKIDIGGISLIRAAAKNYYDVACIPSKVDYKSFLSIIKNNDCEISLKDRKKFASNAFKISSNYDYHINNYFSDINETPLRYGENPHQNGIFTGNLNQIFTKLHGKELSYNNLLDIDAALDLMKEFKNEKHTFAILKHNNACGISNRESLKKSYMSALEADPISAFGGILICNSKMDVETAEIINTLF